MPIATSAVKNVATPAVRIRVDLGRGRDGCSALVDGAADEATGSLRRHFAIDTPSVGRSGPGGNPALGCCVGGVNDTL
ncbi:hypothetical protein GCM10022204_43620 [Microlunatus aurantiacus]|uniref:Uncharacterized protein n=1 Tax=Microlunatus aurantiacus TaxID=446786 RepID=A0ABP7EH24_9ACTN